MPLSQLFMARHQEIPAEHALEFFRGLLGPVYQIPALRLSDLRQAGFRILPLDFATKFPVVRGRSAHMDG